MASLQIVLRNALLLLLIAVGTLSAQSPVERRANQLYNNFAYTDAIELYEHLIKKQPDNKNVIRHLADAYRLTNNSNKAEQWQKRLLEAGIATNEDYLYLAQSLESNGKNEEAGRYFEKYKELNSGDPRGARYIRSVKNFSDFFMESESYKVENLGLNTIGSDFSAAYYPGGILLVSNGHEKSFPKSLFPWNRQPWLDIYEASGSSDSTLGEAKPFQGKLNSKYHEGPMSYDAKTQTLAFTRNNYFKGKVRRSADHVNKLTIFFVSKSADKWGEITPFPHNSREYSCGHPSFSEDGKRLYFSSDMPGGYGGSDLYVSRLENNSWTKPENLGASINTSGNELFPFIYKDSLLCFASNGWGGMGGLDIFRSEIKSGQFAQPENIGAPVNSPSDDFGFIFNQYGKNGFFSSNRTGGKGSDDIYRFSYKMRPTSLILVDQDEVKAVQKGHIKLYQKDELLVDQATDGEGKALLMLRPCTEYKVISSGEGYPSHEQVISSNCPLSKKEDIRVLMKRPKVYVNVFDKYLNKDIANAVVEVKDITQPEAALQTGETDAKGFIRFYLEPCHEYQVLAKKAGLPEVSQKVKAPCAEKENDAVARLGTGIAPKRGIPLLIRVTDEQSNSPVANAKVKLVNKKTNELMEIFTDETGSYETVLVENTAWSLAANRIGYFSTSKSKAEVNAAGSGNRLVRDLKLLRLKEGGVIALEGIYYDLAKSDIRPDAAKVLDYVVQVMEENPSMVIELGSHTDARGSDENNLKLSDARAKSAADYIVSKGIASNRISGKGYGETQLKNKCGNGVKCAEALHQENRRTEIKVLDFE
ncbi:MAG: hypothetical protein RLZZ543_1494 [Bacteroidota bacterium]|jgi:outer membrane protein OmpA-like peptidoglycan-associated protein